MSIYLAERDYINNPDLGNHNPELGDSIAMQDYRDALNFRGLVSIAVDSVKMGADAPIDPTDPIVMVFRTSPAASEQEITVLEARRDKFLSRVLALDGLVRPLDAVLPIGHGHDKDVKLRAVAAFGAHVLIEREETATDGAVARDYSYAVYPASIFGGLEHAGQPQ